MSLPEMQQARSNTLPGGLMMATRAGLDFEMIVQKASELADKGGLDALRA